MNDWKNILKQLKLEDIKSKAPGFFAASGGYGMDLKPYSDKTSNGLTKAIIDFLQFNGHYANRINTQGQPRVKNIPRFNIFTQKMVVASQTVTWTKSSTWKGTPDIDAVIFGRPAKIEVKINRDTVKEDQKKERTKIEAAGGLYFVARNMPSFLEWYQRILKQSTS